ncbi:MAG: Crp/Fnr family transcriptional regulator [Bacteroidota bacterium]
MKTIWVKKGQILQRQGDRDTKVYVVRKGLLRCYSIDEKGKEHIFLFGPEGTVITDHLPPQVPAELFIDALEDSKVLVREKTLAFAKRNTSRVIGRMIALQTRVVMLMSSSIIERYKYFITTYPQIAERIPQRMIASYLGVTPEALSKAKSKYLQSK